MGSYLENSKYIQIYASCFHAYTSQKVHKPNPKGITNALATWSSVFYFCGDNPFVQLRIVHLLYKKDPLKRPFSTENPL